MELKDVIINYRKENGLSQREFARRCGLSNSLISLLEMGINPQTGKKMSPDLVTYKKLATGMGTTVQAIFEKLDESERISLSFDDLERALDVGEEASKKIGEIRLLVRGLNKLSPEQIRQAREMMKVMFATYADYFDKKENDDET